MSIMDTIQENLFDNQFVQLTQALASRGRNELVSKEFAEQKSDVERVAFVLGLDVVNDYITVPAVRDRKSSESADQLRCSGNKLFQQKDYKESLKYYTRSIAHAPHYREKTEECESSLALAYANRSAALFRLQRWEDCLTDISTALQCSYPQRLMHKLYLRRGQCLLKLHQNEGAVEAFRAGRESVINVEGDVPKRSTVIQEFEQLIAKETEASKCVEAVDGPYADPFLGICGDRLQPELLDDSCNTVFPSLNKCCDVAYTPEKGRYLVAKRDILPGEILLVEKPYASVLLPENYTNFCHHCYKFCYTLIPCMLCSQALYCSAGCRTAAWQSYHQHECGLLGIIHRSGVGKFGHLALRTVAMVCCNDVMKYKDMLVEGKFDIILSPLFQGCDEYGKYMPTNYRTIHCLVTHADDRTVSDLFRRTTMAVFLLKCLEESSYFQKCPHDLHQTIMTFVGGLILSHLQSFPCNAHEIAEFELDRENLVESAPMELGAGIYSTLSLFNHSCDPGVNRNFYGDVCVVRAIKTIRAGEEIADNYGVVYAVHPREQRRKKLLSQYYFDCNCKPCEKNWPLYPCIENTTPSWRCKTCHVVLTDNNGVLRCERCDTKELVSERLSAMLASQKKYETAFENLMACEVDSSLSSLLDYLRVLDDNLCLPWREYNNCQEAVKQCLSIMGNCHIVTAQNV